MIDQYHKSGHASWKGVVSALREIGEHTLANHLEGKYIKQRESTSCVQKLVRFKIGFKFYVNGRLVLVYINTALLVIFSLE